MKISRRRKGQLIVSCQVVTDPCCGLSVIFCGFISHLIGHENKHSRNFLWCSPFYGKDCNNDTKSCIDVIIILFSFGLATLSHMSVSYTRPQANSAPSGKML